MYKYVYAKVDIYISGTKMKNFTLVFENRFMVFQNILRDW